MILRRLNDAFLLEVINLTSEKLSIKLDLAISPGFKYTTKLLWQKCTYSDYINSNRDSDLKNALYFTFIDPQSRQVIAHVKHRSECTLAKGVLLSD